MEASPANLTLILAVFSTLGPLFFGFIVWKLSATFATKEETNKRLDWLEKHVDDLRMGKTIK